MYYFKAPSQITDHRPSLRLVERHLIRSLNDAVRVGSTSSATKLFVWGPVYLHMERYVRHQAFIQDRCVQNVFQDLHVP